MDAGEILQALLQHPESHGVLHHIDALQLEVVHGVEGRQAAGVGLGQSQELLARRGDGLAGGVVSKGTRWSDEDRGKKR